MKEIRIDLERPNIRLVNAYRAETYKEDIERKKLKDEAGDTEPDAPNGK